jgi:hypothetical protein
VLPESLVFDGKHDLEEGIAGQIPFWMKFFGKPAEVEVLVCVGA